MSHKNKKSVKKPSKKVVPKKGSAKGSSSKIDYTYNPKTESPTQYNARIASARGDTAQQLASQNATLSGKVNSDGSFKPPTESVGQTLAKSKAILDQTQAQGGTPFAGSTFEQNLPPPVVPAPVVPAPITPEAIAGAITDGMGQNATATTPDQPQTQPVQQVDGQGNVLPPATPQNGFTGSQGGNVSQGTPLSNPSVVDYLNSTGQPSDFTSRKAMAERLGISGYTGTTHQNQQLLSSVRGNAVSPSETITPTSAGAISQTSNTAPVSSTQSLITNADKFGLTHTKNDFQTDPIKTIKDITKQVFSAMGLDQANTEIKNIGNELEDLQNKKDDEVRAINDDPWLTEGVRQRQIQKADEKWADRIDSRVNKLQLLESVQKDAVQQAQFAVGTAISLYDSERRFQAAQVQSYYDQAQQEFDNSLKLQELDLKKQGGSGTSDMQEYLFAVQQGFSGDFLAFKKAVGVAGRAPVNGGVPTTSGFVNSTTESSIREDAGALLDQVDSGDITIDQAYKKLRLLYSPNEASDQSLKDLLGISNNTNVPVSGLLGNDVTISAPHGSYSSANTTPSSGPTLTSIFNYLFSK